MLLYQDIDPRTCPQAVAPTKLTPFGQTMKVLSLLIPVTALAPVAIDLQFSQDIPFKLLLV